MARGAVCCNISTIVRTIVQMVSPGHTVDRADPLPLWAQVLEDLRRRLAAGEFSQHFPTDEQLVAQYGVSRQTVREAVRRLADAGLVERVRGRGTRLVTFEHVDGTMDSLYAQVRRQGATQRSRVLARRRERSGEVARRLRLGPEGELVFIERLRLADGEPLALDRAWLPAALAAPLLEADLSDTALYTELACLCGITELRGDERIRPVNPSARDRRLLALPRGEAALSIQRLTASPGLGPVEWRESLVRGDRYVIRLEDRRWPGPAALPWAPARP
jgi:GntR family transcriptional regulator